MSNTPVTERFLTELTQSWLNFASYHEVGFFVYAPNSAPDRRIIQLFKDDRLQRKVVKNYDKTLLFYVDFKDEPPLHLSDIAHVLLGSIKTALDRRKIESDYKEVLTILEDLESRGYELIFFVVGLDYQLKGSHIQTVKELISVYERFRKMAVLFFTNVYISPMKEQLLSKHTASSNVFYVPLYSDEDSLQFLHFMLCYWSLDITSEQKKWILDYCKGKFGLIKNALRIIRENHDISPYEIANNPLMVDRATSILENLPESAALVVAKLNNSSKLTQEELGVSEYLLKTGLVQKEADAYQLFPPYLRRFKLDVNTESGSSEEEKKLQLIFSENEYKLILALIENTEKILTRDEVGEIIWGQDSDEYYSDWAIDQLIHRLRSKIKSEGLPFELITKKGLGFALVHR